MNLDVQGLGFEDPKPETPKPFHSKPRARPKLWRVGVCFPPHGPTIPESSLSYSGFSIHPTCKLCFNYLIVQVLSLLGVGSVEFSGYGLIRKGLSLGRPARLKKVATASASTGIFGSGF